MKKMESALLVLSQVVVFLGDCYAQEAHCEVKQDCVEVVESSGSSAVHLSNEEHSLRLDNLHEID